MSFAPRTRDAIRTATLGFLQVRFAALGLRVDVSGGSFLYLLCDALAIEDEGIEAAAAAIVQVVLVSGAGGADLDRHGAVYGLPREPQATARLTLAATGSSATYALTAANTLVGSTGLVYACVAASLVLPSPGTFDVVCLTPGAAGTSAVNAVFAWTSAPAGLASTAVVNAIVTSGSDGEGSAATGYTAAGDASYRARILSRIQNRPASGNRADWQDWAQQVEGVAQAYVYPLLSPALVPAVPGCVTLVPVGPVSVDVNGAQTGDDPTNTRFVSGTIATRVAGYIEGTKDIAGNPVTGRQLRPVTMLAGDYTIAPPVHDQPDVSVQLVLDPSVAFEWTGTMTVDVTSDTTHLVVSGDHRALDGKHALVQLATNHLRGNYQMVLLPAGSTFGGGVTSWTFASQAAPYPVPAPEAALLGAPVSGSTVFPAPGGGSGAGGIWHRARQAAFAYFDSLGPGVGPAVGTPSTRWPPEGAGSRATFYRSALAAAILNAVPKVLAATGAAPGVDVVPPATHIVDLFSFWVLAP